MAKEKRVTTGLVLRAVDTKETDRILTVLTADLGKISVVAKGARSRRSRVAAATQPLAYAEMTLTESHGWQILSEANTIALFDGVSRDVELLALASYFAELVDAVTYEGMSAPEVLALTLNALYALGELGRDQMLVKAAFELRLMALAGFEPFSEGCLRCGAEQPAEPMLDVVRGEVHCAGCRVSGGLAMPLEAGGLAALRHILRCDPTRLYSFTLEKEPLERLSHAAEAYVAAQLERGFRTLDFYKSLRRDLTVSL